MKTKLNSIFLAVQIIMILNWSCTKIDLPLTLPEETQTGANTFGCKVDGEVWRVMTDKEKRKDSEDGVHVTLLQDSILYIRAVDLIPNSISNYAFSLWFKLKPNEHQLSTTDTINFIQMDDYTINHSFFRSCKDCFLDSNPPGKVFQGEQKDKGILIITRLDDKIVSGKFEGILNSYYNTSVVITEGRFDVNLKH